MITGIPLPAETERLSRTTVYSHNIMNMCGSLDLIASIILCISSVTLGEEMACGPMGNVSIISSLVGQPWIMCFQPGTENLQRLTISHNNGLEMEKSCTKFNSSSWSVGDSLSLTRNNVSVACPGPRRYTMCLTAFNGGMNDIGWWKFTIVDSYGNREELCSKYLILKTRDFPWLKTECIDFQNSMVALDMDFEEGSEVEFNISVSYIDGTHLCHGRNYFACNVSRAVMKDILEMHGSNVADNVTVTYQSQNLKRVTRSANTLEVKKECRSSMNRDSPEDKDGLGLGESLALILSIGIVFISAIAGFILYKEGKCEKCMSFFQQRKIYKSEQKEDEPVEDPSFTGADYLEVLNVVKSSPVQPVDDPGSKLMEKPNDGEEDTDSSEVESIVERY